MNGSDDSVHILPVLIMVVGMLIIGAGIIGEFDGPKPLRGNGSLVLAVLGVAILLGGALLL